MTLPSLDVYPPGALRCAICGDSLSFHWTDSHGVAQCGRCGAPYRLIHYESGLRIEKPAEPLIAKEWVSFHRRCFAETGARLSAVAMRLSFPGGYDVATQEDVESVSRWWKAQPEADR